MIFGSVCSGIEAASAAWHPLGWRAAFLSEIEAFPRAVLKHHYPEVPLHGDFTTIRAGEYEPIDLLVGGTPCQSFSVAGLRGGLDDDRGNLALEYLRLADRLRPRWLVWENVPGVLSSAGGRDFGAILGGMVELGYGLAYRVFDAQHFGVPQRRRRVFVVGYLGDWRRAAAVLFERHSLSGHPAPCRQAGESAPTIPSRSSAGGGLGTDFDCDDGLIANCLNAKGGSGRMDGESETFIAQPIPILEVGKGTTSRGAGPNGCGIGLPGDAMYTLQAGAQHAIAFNLRGREGGAMPEAADQASLRAASGGSTNSYVAFDTTQITSAANYSNPQPGDACHPLAAGAHAPAIAFNITPSNSNKDYNAREASYSQAITGNGNRPSARGGDLITGSAVRRLTPVECARLQGFPDDYLTQVTWRGKSPPPDGPMYKALGNSMAIPVVSWIGQRIAAVDALQSTHKAA